MPIALAHCTLTWTPEGCTTRFPDGTAADAAPHDTPHYHVISHRCGYGGDLMAYCREHEFAHAFMQEWLAGGPSPVLMGLARGTPVPEAQSVTEELAAQSFQRWLRANERPIAGGTDWDRMKRNALALLNGA